VSESVVGPADAAGGAFAPEANVVVLATRSAGKLRELGALFAEQGWCAVTLDMLGIAEHPDEEALEVHETFEANALAKARYFADRTGRLIVADDSGLEVDALDGRPGVRSKRWSGSPLTGEALDAANNAFLQAALGEARAAGHGSRRARYVCAVACAWPEGERVVRGVTEGEILETPRGCGGFGYDPYFLSADLGATFAEVDGDAKARVSHRGRAFRLLLQSVGIFDAPVDRGARLG
jgi:XTP/dITP diphosphohydrolase